MSDVSEPVLRPSITQLFMVFFRIGLMSFGGGVSGWIFREVVIHHKWLTENEFMSILATSQMLPGSNIGNLAVTIGHRQHGILGSCIALFALMSGPFFAVIALASVYSALQSVPFSEAAMDGIAAAAIGLSVIVAGRGVRRAARRPESLIALVATFVGVGLLHFSFPLVVVCVGSLSIAAAWRRAGHEG